MDRDGAYRCSHMDTDLRNQPSTPMNCPMMQGGNMMDMSSSGGMMDMSMADMSQMLQWKTGDDLDRAFLEGMIPHHQWAVDMAQYLVNAKHPELRKMGQDIIVGQGKEIDQMNIWMKEWGYISTGSVTGSGMNMHMMPDGTMMNN